jgi:hypothetical protein
MRWLLCLSVILGLSGSGFGQDNPAETTNPKSGVVAHDQIKNEVDRRFNEGEFFSVSDWLSPKNSIEVYDSRGEKRIKLPEISGEVKSLKND